MIRALRRLMEMMAVDREAQLRDWLHAHQGILARLSRAYALDPGDEEDLLQEIGLALWQSLPRFRGDAKPSTWIFQVALHVALSRRRAQRRRPPAAPLGTTAEPASDGVASATRRLEWGAVLQALRQAAPIDRAVLILALEGATQQDIGDVLGISANAAGVRLHRARKRLIERMEGR